MDNIENKKDANPIDERPPASNKKSADNDLDIIDQLNLFDEYSCSSRVEVTIDEDAFNLARSLLLFVPQLKNQQDLIDNIIRKGLLMVALDYKTEIRKTLKLNPYDKLIRRARKEVENG